MCPQPRSPINRRAGSCAALCRRTARWAAFGSEMELPASCCKATQIVDMLTSACSPPANRCTSTAIGQRNDAFGGTMRRNARNLSDTIRAEGAAAGAWTLATSQPIRTVHYDPHDWQASGKSWVREPWSRSGNDYAPAKRVNG